MPQPVKYTIYHKGDTKWWPQFYMNAVGRFIRRMNEIVKQTPHPHRHLRSYLVRVFHQELVGFDSPVEWFTVEHSPEDGGWRLNEIDTKFLEEEGLHGE